MVTDHLQFSFFDADNQLNSMDNSAANQDTIPSDNSASIYCNQLQNMISSFLDLSSSSLPYSSQDSPIPATTFLSQHRKDRLEIESMQDQKSQMSDQVYVQIIEGQSIHTAHTEQLDANHDLPKISTQSKKQNMPKYLAKNIKKLIANYLPSAQPQRQEELNQLYLKFFSQNLGNSLKSLNSFCFRKVQTNINEKFRNFIQNIKRQDLQITNNEEWNDTINQCQSFLKEFIINHEEELVKFAQERQIKNEDKKAGLSWYTQRFIQTLRVGKQRGKDVKEKTPRRNNVTARRSTQ